MITQLARRSRPFFLIVHDSDDPLLQQRPAMFTSQNSLAISSGDLLISSLPQVPGSATVYPFEDTILAVLQARFHADLPYTRIGSSSLLVIHPNLYAHCKRNNYCLLFCLKCVIYILTNVFNSAYISHVI